MTLRTCPVKRTGKLQCKQLNPFVDIENPEVKSCLRLLHSTHEFTLLRCLMQACGVYSLPPQKILEWGPDFFLSLGVSNKGPSSDHSSLYVRKSWEIRVTNRTSYAICGPWHKNANMGTLVQKHRKFLKYKNLSFAYLLFPCICTHAASDFT